MEVNGRKLIRTEREALNALQNDTVIGFDTETGGLNPWVHDIHTIQLYGQQSDSLVLLQYKNGVIHPDIREFLGDPKRLFIGHNVVGFDIPMLAGAYVPWEGARWYDSLVGEQVCVTTSRRDVKKSLKAALKRRLNVIVDKTIAHGRWHCDLTEDQILYATEDVVHLPALREAQLLAAKKSSQLEAMQLEQDIMPYIAMMTIRGLPCTPEKMVEFINMQEALEEELDAQMCDAFGEINFNSTQQLKRAVKERYGYEWPATNKHTLKVIALKGGHEGRLAKLLLDHKVPAQRLKMYNYGFIDNYIVNDLIHANFWQVGAATGRFTSSNPNLQQIPRDARWVIGNRPGFKVIACDYSQAELRVAAYLSGDTVLQQALDYDDVHRAVAAMMFQKDPEDISVEERRKAKAASFTLLFVGGAQRLFEQAQDDGAPISRAEAEHIFKLFFARFQGLKAMRTKAIVLSKQRRANQIVMPHGLKRTLVGQSNRPSVIANSWVQGFAASCMKQGIKKAGEAGLMQYVGATVHDELVAWIEEKHADELARELEKAMVEGMQVYLPVGAKAEAKVGDVWLK
jgi:DNA polymerase-1